MEYSKVISITGLPGLYELINTKSDGAIVRSLDDQATRFISSRVHNFSHLESIEVFTVRDNVNLVEVFNAMKESKEPLPGDKDGNQARVYFEKVYPDMDFDRVYPSDMKKMVKWYEVLTRHNIEPKLEEEPEMLEEEEETVEPAKPEPAKPAKKASASAETKSSSPAKKAETTKTATKKTEKEAPKKTASKTAGKKK